MTNAAKMLLFHSKNLLNMPICWLNVLLFVCFIDLNKIKAYTVIMSTKQAQKGEKQKRKEEKNIHI